MMVLLRRLRKRLVDAFGSFVAPAEDPRQAAENTHDRQRALLVKVRRAVASMEATRERLAAKAARICEQLTEYEREARQMLIAGREDAARLALRQHHLAAIELSYLENQLDEILEEVRRLTVLEQRLVRQIEAYHARRQAIAARQSAAEAQLEIHRAVRSVYRDLSDLDDVLARAERQADQAEARAEWQEGLLPPGQQSGLGDVAGYLAARLFGQNEVDLVVEAQIEKLKAEPGPGQAADPGKLDRSVTG